MERLSSAIQQRDTPLHLLDLLGNKFDDIRVSSVATCLHKVDQLVLRDCGITSKGMERLSSAIQQRDTPMKRVKLGGNDSSRESGEHIAKCLHNIEDYQHVVYTRAYQQADGSNVVERTIQQLKQLDEYMFTNESLSSVGSGGARLEVGGCVVEIPPGALDRQVHIKLTSYYGKNEEESESFTPMLKCEPHQLNFLKPVRITLPTCYVTEDDQNAQVVVRTSMNRWDWKDFATIMYRNDLRISFDTRHFSFFDTYWPQWSWLQFFSKFKSIVFRKPECFLHKTSLAVKSTLVFADYGQEATQEMDIFHSTIKIGKDDDIDFELKAANDDLEPDDHYVVIKGDVKMKHNSIRDEFNFKIIKDMEFYPNQFSTGISCMMKNAKNELIKRWICVVVDPADIPLAPPQRHGDSPTHNESVNQSGGISTQGRVNAEVSRQITQTLATTEQIADQLQQTTIHLQKIHINTQPLSPERQKLEKVFQVVGRNMSRMQEGRLFYFTLELSVQEAGDIPGGTVGSRAMHGLEMWRQKNPSKSAQDLVEFLKANELMSIAVECEEALQRFEDSAAREDSEEGGDPTDPD